MRCALRLLMMPLLLGLASCQSLVPVRETPAEGPLPGAFTATGTADPNLASWWQQLDSAELNGLVETALADNLSLTQAWARLTQAEATAVRAGAARWPEANLTAGAGWTRTRTEGSLGAAAFGSGSAAVVIPRGRGPVTYDRELYSLGLAASYEIDLWGRVRAGHEAALLHVAAARDDLEAACMTIAARVAEVYMQVVEQRAQQRLIRAQHETNLTLLELVELRFRKSAASALDVYQQRQAVARPEAQLPLAQQQEMIARHQLAALLAQPATETLSVTNEQLPDLPPLPDAGVPADLLGRRPDVRAALRRLEAADQRVGVARADRLPALRLTGQASFQSEELPRLFNDWFTNLAANLTAPLFDGSRREAEEQRTRAVVAERLAAYRETVLRAIQEVEDALVRERTQREHLRALDRELEASRLALREARARYGKGLSDYLPVLTALATTQALERSHLQRERELVVYRINLYRALGGDWSDRLAPAGSTELSRQEEQP